MSQPTWPFVFTPPAPAFSFSPGRTTTKSAAFVARSSDRRPFSIIAVCHLSWDWVWQRPQQFLSRFAQRHPVLFIETYCSPVETTSVEIRPVDGHPNVTRALMHLPEARWSDGAFIDAERRRALQVALKGPLGGRFIDPVLWFNDPMAVTAFAGHLGEQAIVYDCMDELSQFRGAPPEMLEREHILLRAADVVFCGGQKMRETRLRLNANTHFFGTGVDVEHFGAALTPALPPAPELAALGQAPILGYFGVIDERLDYRLIAQLADARADWHVVMVGPVAKVDPADFPQRPNLHWLGPRPYTDLPGLTKSFRVCLMPFALNASTEYINPTKALEYMAAGRPVVSTALGEVKSNFSTAAHIAASPEEFIALCRRETDRPTMHRIKAGLRLAENNTWEALMVKMERHIVNVLPVPA